ncbi:MAG: hypothetical protein BRC29_05390 [Nanohaloarchaea archaeon SW_7_43_1]|nr:MAG: hypothetical protein BRC29_05390 [Nanohaloarchaea archaeon SW_7_43_1]
MIGNRRYLRLGETLIIITVLFTGYLGGMISTHQSTGLDEEPVYNPSYNLTCPEPVTNVEMNSQNQDRRETGNYIQAAYTQIDYDTQQGNIRVDASAVSKPEGKSMRPAIFSGNTVLMKEYKGGSISEGDILRYSTDSGTVIHRVQANYLNTGDYLLMKGDNNEYGSQIQRSQITHRVVGILYTSREDTGTTLN